MPGAKQLEKTLLESWESKFGLHIRRHSEIIDNFLSCDNGIDVVLENVLTLRRSIMKHLEVKHMMFIT